MCCLRFGVKISIYIFCIFYSLVDEGNMKKVISQSLVIVEPLSSTHMFLESATGLLLITGRTLGFLLTLKDNISLSFLKI